MSKKYYFISGLPRSGSTLLCNILAQNPRFYASSTSGILDVIFGIRNSWDSHIEFQAMRPEESQASKLRVMRGILVNYYDNIDIPVIFDKSRGWLAHLEMAEAILDHEIRVLVPVRDIRDVLASYEKIWRRMSAQQQMSMEPENYYQMQTVEGRCAVWAMSDQAIGLAYNRIKDALHRGYQEDLHFVQYESLTKNPEATLRDIYEYLGEDYYIHDFNNVKQVTYENDAVHGMPLHRIQRRVTPQEAQWPEFLGNAAEKYKGTELW